MSVENLNLSGGILHVPVSMDGVDTGRSLDFNPSDQGFAEDLYGLVSKLSKIHEENRERYEAAQEPADKFDISREEDRLMCSAVNMAKRDARIRKYTEKYQKYRK